MWEINWGINAHIVFWIILIHNIVLFRWFFKKNNEALESMQVMVDKIAELGARQLILESKMGYEVTSIEISKQSKH